MDAEPNPRQDDTRDSEKSDGQRQQKGDDKRCGDQPADQLAGETSAQNVDAGASRVIEWLDRPNYSPPGWLSRLINPPGSRK